MSAALWLWCSLVGAAVTPPPSSVDLKAIKVVERLGESLPDLSFNDLEGRPTKLSTLFSHERPVILSLVYHRCPTLCSLVLDGLVSALKQTGLTLGEDYDLVTVSIDPDESVPLAEQKHKEVIRALGRPEGATGWTFLQGDAGSIRSLAESVGFHYAYDSELKQFAHAAVLFTLTPEGKISRYLYGVRFPPRDLRLALVEAARGRVGTAFDRFLLTCYRYDPASRRYELYMKVFLRGGALLVFVGLFGMLATLWKRELKGVRP